MKLADTDSKLGRTLETWVVGEKKEKKKSRLKRRLEKWLTEEEKKEQIYIVEEKKGARRQILMATSQRAILFENNLFFGKLKDTSDKAWEQFISIHLTEGVLSSSLELCFFRYHDSNNHQESVEWVLSGLDKEKAREFYAYLKDKEMALKESRRA
ncbi:MAG: hypothetical protein WGN25_14425 [Candidatus Electrothrix sp. GW3-4]|uniref:hypothetical protein n=1 Tax=Candidatus Electrothrix sp. GW3-4 TaxID=3126740 RepID=UPI0030CC6637